jgi:hypothetical protein
LKIQPRLCPASLNLSMHWCTIGHNTIRQTILFAEKCLIHNSVIFPTGFAGQGFISKYPSVFS